MATLADILSDVQGLRNDAATSIVDQYSSVDELARAEVDELVEIKGVGDVMAQRVIDAARSAGVGDAADAVTDTTDQVARSASEAVSESATTARTAVSSARDRVAASGTVVDEAAQTAQDGIGLARRGVAGLIAHVERVASTAVAAAGREVGDGVEWTGTEVTSPVDRVAAFTGGLVGKGIHTARILTTTTAKLLGGVAGRVRG